MLQPFACAIAIAFGAFVLAVATTSASATSAQFSYSTSGAEVNGRRIFLGPDSDSLQGYTHYLVRSTAELHSGSETAYTYTFTVQLAATPTRRNNTGIFITVSELSDPNGKTAATGSLLESMARKSKSKVCLNFQITLSYPQDPDKLPVRLCKPKGEFTDSVNVHDLLTFGDYVSLDGRGRGSGSRGSAQVRVRVEWMPPRGLNALYGYGTVTDTDPWRRSGAHAPGSAVSLPAEAVGAIVFTAYQDCQMASSPSDGRPAEHLRPCTSLHNLTCIAAELYCDSEPNCVTPAWELADEPAVCGPGRGAHWMETSHVHAHAHFPYDTG